MTALVIDASVAVKWVVEEQGTSAALALRGSARLLAPDLLVPECANVLWKKVERGELSAEEALLAARLLQGADVELFSTRAFLETSARLAIELGHPAYDCVYLALAIDNDCDFATADAGFARKVRERGAPGLRERVSTLGASGAARGGVRSTGGTRADER